MKAISVKQSIYKCALMAALVLLSAGSSFAGTNSTENRKPIYREIVDKPAELLDGYSSLREKISYPRAAMLAGYEGKVVAKVYVNESGKVDGIDFIKKMGGGFETAVRKAIFDTKFVPALHNHKPVKSVAVLTFRFEMDQNRENKLP